MTRSVILAALAGVLALSLWLAWGRDLTPETLRAQLALVADLRRDRPVATAAGFAALYVAATALSLPVAVWLSLAAGALFGFWQGLALALLASAAGATLACLVARTLARDAVRSRLGTRMAAIEAGLARDGALYLFTLRLIPVVPFFAVNLLMGLTRIRLWTFFWVSLAGMLAGTAIYVNAGTRLARLDSLSGLISGPVLASFAALAAFPWVARAVVRLVQRGRR